MPNPLRMPVGTSAKEEADKLQCEECGIETDILYTIMKPQGGVKACESCYQKYWLKQGYKV